MEVSEEAERERPFGGEAKRLQGHTNKSSCLKSTPLPQHDQAWKLLLLVSHRGESSSWTSFLASLF